MNSFFFTVQIVTWPKRYISLSDQTFTHFIVRIPNSKKGYFYYYMHATAQGNTGMHLLDWYGKGDYLIIEGRLIIKQTKSKTINIELLVTKEAPIILEI